ncbi:MAG: HAD family hydrolase [Patescibacteria group bacterium]|jgi:hydroxymethylpyrimidine pyrophosphatase-like HAD family hydrolase
MTKFMIPKAYRESVIWHKSQGHKKQKRAFPVLLTDIDNTFYSPETVDDMWRLYNYLQYLCWGLVYITGRRREMVEGIESLPQFDVMAVSLGSEIYVRQLNGRYLQDTDHAQLSDKNLAALYLQKQLDFSGVVAGDGAVDYSMIFESGMPAIIVGGAEPFLRDKVFALEKIDEKIRALPNGNPIFVGDDKEDLAVRGIINALQSDFFKIDGLSLGR